MFDGLTSSAIITEATTWGAVIAGVVLIAIGYRVVLRVANWVVAKFGGR